MDRTEFNRLCGTAEHIAEKYGMVSIPIVQQTLGVGYLVARDVVNALVERGSIEFVGGVEYKKKNVCGPNVLEARSRLNELRGKLDERLPAAALVCAQNGAASVPLVQRSLGISVVHSSRMFDQMRKIGLFATDDGKRSFLFTEAEVRAVFGMSAEDGLDYTDPTLSQPIVVAPEPIIVADDDKADKPTPHDPDLDAMFERLKKLSENDGNSADEPPDLFENADDGGDDEEFMTLEQMLEATRDSVDHSNYVDLFSRLFYARDKATLLGKLKAIDHIIREQFSSFDLFYDDIVGRVERMDEQEAAQRFSAVCNAWLDHVRADSFGQKLYVDGETLLYKIHECMLRVVANNLESDIDTVIEAAREEVKRVPKNDRVGEYVAKAALDELMRFAMVSLPFIKAEALRIKSENPPRRWVDVTYVVDGSNRGALYEYATAVKTAVETRLSKYCHSAAGDESTAFRERMICYGNRHDDCGNTISMTTLGEMPYAGAPHNEWLGVSHVKKLSTQDKNNGLEALWRAMEISAYGVPENVELRHIIVVLTNTQAYAPGEKPIVDDDDKGGYPYTPDGYREEWERKATGNVKTTKILVVCAPKSKSGDGEWQKLADWKRAYVVDDGCKNLKPELLADYICMLDTETPADDDQ